MYLPSFLTATQKHCKDNQFSGIASIFLKIFKMANHPFLRPAVVVVAIPAVAPLSAFLRRSFRSRCSSLGICCLARPSTAKHTQLNRCRTGQPLFFPLPPPTIFLAVLCRENLAFVNVRQANVYYFRASFFYLKQ